MLIDFTIRFMDDSDDDRWDAGYKSASELCYLIARLLELRDWEIEKDYLNYN